MPPATKPATKPAANAPTGPVAGDEETTVAMGGLTPDEEKLLAELQERAAQGDRVLAIDRPPTPREAVLSAELRERNHLDGCPAIEERGKYAARIEAYTDTIPPNPQRGLGPRNIVVIRCVECGGSQHDHDHTSPDELIIARLRARQGTAAVSADALDDAL